MESVLGELQCPVCLELFQQPTVLPCSHVLCRTPCAERLFENGFLRCPVCRDRSFVSGGIQSLPRVLSLENIIESCFNRNANATPELSEEDRCQEGDIACQLCDVSPRKAKKSCLDCNASYCQPCLALSHPVREPFSNHQLVEPRRYPKPHEPRCPLHDMRVNIYCADCHRLGCLLCADDKDGHVGHRIMSLEQAAESIRSSVVEGLTKLEENKDMVGDMLAALQSRQTTMQTKVEERRAQIMDQCRSLIREVELKQEFFLSDLDYEQKLKGDLTSSHLEELGAGSVALQSLQHFTQEVLKETDTCAFIQLATKATEKLSKSLMTCESLSINSPATVLSQKVVDLRKECALLRGMEYLNGPAKPTIAFVKSSHSATKVVLVLEAACSDTDIVDGYQLFSCSEAEKRVGDQHAAVYKTPQQSRWSFRPAADPAATCLLVEGLAEATMYFFCVQAFNEAGASENSPIFNCQTLKEEPPAFPDRKRPQMGRLVCHESQLVSVEERILVLEDVRGIQFDQCRRYTFSVQIASDTPPPSEALPPGATHFLLYRQAAPRNVWRSVRMHGRPTHQVLGLEADTPYEFTVMTRDAEGHCVLSDVITLQTERDT